MAQYEQITADQLLDHHGKPTQMYEPVECPHCGAQGWDLLQPQWMREGDANPAEAL